MPQARKKDALIAKQEELIEVCKENGYNYSDRLHVRIYGDKKGPHYGKRLEKSLRRAPGRRP